YTVFSEQVYLDVVGKIEEETRYAGDIPAPFVHGQAHHVPVEVAHALCHRRRHGDGMVVEFQDLQCHSFFLRFAPAPCRAPTTVRVTDSTCYKLSVKQAPRGSRGCYQTNSKVGRSFSVSDRCR